MASLSSTEAAAASGLSSSPDAAVGDVLLEAPRAAALLMAAAQQQGALAAERAARASAEARARALAGVSEELRRVSEDSARLARALAALQADNDALALRAAAAEARLARVGLAPP